MGVKSKSQRGSKVQDEHKTSPQAPSFAMDASCSPKLGEFNDKVKRNLEQLINSTQNEHSEKINHHSQVSNFSSLSPRAGKYYNLPREGIESPPSVCKPPKKVTNRFRAGVEQGLAPMKEVSRASATQLLSQHESKPVLKKGPLANFLCKPQNKAVESSRMLVTVNISGSTGPLRFLVNTKDPAIRVIDLSLRAYAKEGRLPHLGVDCKLVDLSCLNRDFEALDPNQPVGSLGTRHFLLHKKRDEEFNAMAGKIKHTGAMPWKFVWNKMNSVICSH